MIGVFDSGVGGIAAVTELRALLPRADICFFADRQNAPYGTKDEDALLSLVGRDIRLLRDMGAEKILMACCTASTVYGSLTPEYQALAVPIINPTAKRAHEVTKNGRIGVIATEHTVRSRAFERALAREGADEVISVAAQPLVVLIERGERDGTASAEARELMRELLSPLTRAGIDTLILGCTHFPHLSGTLSSLMRGVSLVSSAREGAIEMKRLSPASGRGITKYITEKTGRRKD